MDFFEAQARAKRRTNRLVLLFVLAVLGTIAASYLAAVLIVGQTGKSRHRDYYDSSPELVYWDPTLALGVSAVTLLVVGAASLFKWSQLRDGGAAVAAQVGGRRIDPRTTDLHERRLLNVVEEMAIASGTPVPAVFVLDEEDGINAFAAGLTTSDAVVAVTRGTLQKLNRDELQGVIGHEFSHILNGDMRLNVRLTAILFGILVLGLIGRGILRTLGRGRIRTSGGGKGKGGGIALVLAVGLALLIIGYVGYFFGRLIQAAVSRQREFLADASAVQFTRNPLGLTGALKKIGGYALGSSIENHDASQFSHFFFAQGFRSAFDGLWATHPPLDERIRAVDARWDGKFFEPPAVVDVERESFASAAARHRSPDAAARSAGFQPTSPAQAPSALPPLVREVVREGEPATVPFAAANVLAATGALADAHLAQARSLLAAVPAPLRDATRGVETAVPLVYALLLDRDAAARERQFALIAQHSGENFAAATRATAASLTTLADDARLPLFQLTLPALRTLDVSAHDRLRATLDALIRADGTVSLYEFALQKMLLRQLAAARTPRALVQFQSFQPLAADLAVLLSQLARAAGDEPAAVTRAFAAGARQLPLLAGQLALLEPARAGLPQLDAALDRLALASLPIKQRTLAACAHAIGADGVVTPREADLYRAISAVLDCPAPLHAAAA